MKKKLFLFLRAEKLLKRSRRRVCVPRYNLMRETESDRPEITFYSLGFTNFRFWSSFFFGSDIFDFPRFDLFFTQRSEKEIVDKRK